MPEPSQNQRPRLHTVGGRNVSPSWPRCNSGLAADPGLEERINSLLAKMSLEQKVGQMMQPEIRHVTPEEVGDYHIGSVLNGGGSFPHGDKHASADQWVALADAYYDASMRATDEHVPIPIMWGVDAVHGHNNVFGATVFPHNVGLGATRNPELIERIAEITALEVAATGIDWSFAPTLAVVRDDRWGRGYEGYAETPDIVAEYAERMVIGLQGSPSGTFLPNDRVVATAKHYIGDGGTEHGIDQGDNPVAEEELRDIHAPGYFTALDAGVQTVMATFNSWRGEKVHGHYYLLTEVLKHQMGFDGFVVSDWNGFKQVDLHDSQSCKNSINAGVDMIMVPEDWWALIANTIHQVRTGEIAMERIDDAVRRILRVKLRAGLFSKGRPSERMTSRQALIGCAEHRRVARQAVRESLVLLKNDNGLLPLARAQRVLVAGSGADDIGQQCGGWSLTWQGTDNQNSDFPNAQSIWQGIEETVLQAGGVPELSAAGDYSERPDVAIVVFGEQPYAEGEGDRTHLSYSADVPEDLALLRRLSGEGIPVVSVFLTGRPLWVNPELNASSAFVVAWLPGSEGHGVAEVLFRRPDGSVDYDFTGRLSYSWPADAMQATCNFGDEDYQPLFPFGFGLTYADADHAVSPAAGRLHETDNSRHVDLYAGMRIYDRRPIAPFRLFVGDPSDWKVPVTGGKAESASGLVSVVAVDRQLQEDARRVTWSGEGQLYFQAPYGQDFAEYVAQGAALEMHVRVDRSPAGKVCLRMDSGYPVSGDIDITGVLQSFPLGTWMPVSFKLSRFASAGADMSKIDTPMLIWADAAVSLSFADVRMVLPDKRD